MKKMVLIFILSLVSSTVFSADIPKDLYDHLEKFYQDIHENPELAGEEKRTSSKVAAEMHGLGLNVTENIGGYGLVSILKNGSGPVTLVRAELDALPLVEATGLPFKSKVNGKSHSCGHDFHMTVQIGVANMMISNKDKWKGTLVFLTEPSEETITGAKAMIKDGLFNKIPKIDQAIALHDTGRIKKGTLGIIPGYALASVDYCEVTLKGKGGHGGNPEKSIDPVTEAAEFILKLQTVLGREKAAGSPAVISIGSIHGGTSFGIIPNEVKVQVSLRTYDKDLRKFLKKRIQEVAEGIAKTANAPEPTLTWPNEVEAVYNDLVLSERMKNVFISTFGKDVMQKMDPSMAGEDFGLFGAAANVPSLIYFLGERNEKDPLVTVHSPKFYPDLKETMPFAIQSMVAALMDLHKK